MGQDTVLLRYLAKKDKEIGRLYDKLINELAKIGASIGDLDTGRLFSFSDYPKIKGSVEKLLSQYTVKVENVITNGMKESVGMSYDANTALLQGFTRFSDKEVRQQREDAAEAFISSRAKGKDGLNLSQNVWNYTQQAKAEFEAAMSELLEEGIGNGTSAEELGRRIRQKLKNPDMVYRRYHIKKLTTEGKKDVVEWRRKVVDGNGRTRYVKEDLEKVGSGVYRSSRKNALRLAATEINMAYRYADNMRWRSEPFVLGVRIRLSGNHKDDGDICDELCGDYPKTFLWQGWHPRCRCSASPILCSQGEMDKMAKMSGSDYDKYKPKGYVWNMPKQFKDWAERNKASIDKGTRNGKLPYFLKDNKGAIRHANRTDKEVEDILRRARERQERLSKE